MEKLNISQDPAVAEKFATYPDAVRPKLAYLRELILTVAAEEESITTIEETLKWGEPSYLTKWGSTVRIDWKAKTPGQYAVYFKCTSKLVPTFRELYGDRFRYEKNRAILFDLEEPVPGSELKKCIRLALRYHAVKHLPLLGR